MHSIHSTTQCEMYWETDQKTDEMGQEFRLTMQYIYQDKFVLICKLNAE
jgi:hypothetical protein